MYNIGDYIVKSMTGVCKVEAITKLDIRGTDKDKMYYLLLPVEDKSGKIYAPVDMIDESTRVVMSKDEALKLIEEIPNVAETWIEDEKLRREKYKENVKNCNPRELVEVIKMAYVQKRNRLAQGKKNTAVDERYFKVAENSLYTELCFALKKSKDEIRQMIAESAHRQENFT